MPTRKRYSYPASERSVRIAKAITAAALEDGGKLFPKQGIPGGSGIKPDEDENDENEQFTGKKPPKKQPVLKLVEPEGESALDGDNANEDEGADFSDDEIVEVTKRLYIPVLKADIEEKTVTGVVLQPEVVDAQGDIMSAKVIKDAAHGFLAAFNKSTKLGLMHKNFNKQFELLESFVTPSKLTINKKVVKQGSWVITVRVLDAAIWKQVKDGKIRGFSIGGKAKAVKLAA